MRKLTQIISPVLLLLASPASAQQGAWTVGEQPKALPLDDFPAYGAGPPPYYANMPGDITTSGFSVSDFTASGTQIAKTKAQGGMEAKFRTICGTPSHYAYDDPVLYPGQKGRSHLHQFFGNTLTDANSTYRSLRVSGRSNCGGDILNRTAYWTPAMLATVNGQRVIVRPDQFIVYYKNDIDRDHTIWDIPRDFAYIAGPDPHTGFVDPNQARLDAANAAAIAQGKPMRYAFETAQTGRPSNGFAGWKCETKLGNASGTTQYAPYPTSDRQPYLRDANGNLTLNCGARNADNSIGHVIAEFHAPGCWDGVNGHGGPTGRGHVSTALLITNNTTGASRLGCFAGWYALPFLELTIYYPIPNGMNEIVSQNWRWSSDDVQGYTYRAGESGHIDWFGAWDYGTNASPGMMLMWMQNCIGTMNNTPRECDGSAVSPTLALKTDAIPTGYADPPGSLRNGIIVDNNHDWGSKGFRRFTAIPKGPYTLHAHH